ncbi:hypothetical protein BsWGS_24664 [Bradybaena similaris]
MEEVLDPAQTDGSRPAFVRPRCCMGIYLDAIDAVPDKETVIGSRHAFMMTVMGKMLDHLQTCDLAKIKGSLERRHICDGVVLEGFRNGCILAVTFDTAGAVDELWKLHAEDRLTPTCQDILVDKALLKSTNTLKLSLRVKLWEDEYKYCLQEMTRRSANKKQLGCFERDLDMVKRVKEHQKVMPELMLQARDWESNFEHNLGHFMLSVKQGLPGNATAIRNLREFCTDMKQTRGIKKSDFASIDQYFQTLDFFRHAFTVVEENIVHPLCQVRALCEKDKQQKLKKAIKDACAEMMTKLKPETDLQKIRHKEWEPKVLPREQSLFLGLISLVPMCLDRLTTIDLNTDEYIMDFPEMST